MIELEKTLLVVQYAKEGKIDLKDNTTLTVRYVANKLLKEYEKRQKDTNTTKVIYKDYIRVFKNIIKLYENLNIKRLDTQELKKYFNKPFSKTQITITRYCFKEIFEFALQKKQIEFIPKFPKITVKKIKDKTDIKDDTIRALRDRFRTLSKETKSKIAKENFKILEVFIDQLLQTGARYGELRNLKSKNIIEDNLKVFYKFEKSKVETARRTILISHMTEYGLEDLPNNPYKQEFVFQRKDGKLPDFSQILQGDKQRNPDWYKSKGLENFTLYNIRDNFIKRKIEEGKDLFLISQFVGTSIEMIQKHYALNLVNRKYENMHDSLNDQLDELTARG